MSQKLNTSQLVSIHGKRLGLNPGGHLLLDGFLAAANWKDLGVVAEQLDHFVGPTLQSALWTVVKGSDGACANFAKTAKAGGYISATTGAGAGGTMAVNGVQITGAKDFDPGFGSLLCGGAVQMDAITNINVFFGLSDHTTLLAPFTIAGGVVTANATDAAGFVFDTSATAATWKVCTVNNGGTPTLFDTGVAPVISTDNLFALYSDINGNYVFFMDGKNVVNVALATKTGDVLTPTFNGFTQTAASAHLLADFIACQQSR